MSFLGLKNIHKVIEDLKSIAMEEDRAYKKRPLGRIQY